MHMLLFAVLVAAGTLGWLRLFHLVGLFRLSRDMRARQIPHECTDPQRCQTNWLAQRIESTHRQIVRELIAVAVLETATVAFIGAALAAGR